jgi:hypothetical protein
MKTKIIALALAATVLAGGAAAAQDAPPPPPGHHGGLFLRADANKDGVVTRAELLTSIDTRFGKADANHDGKITTEERQGARKAMREARGDGEGRRGGHGRKGPGMRGRADMDKDGVLTLDEARAPALKLFAYVDRNNDGKVEKAEADAFRDATMAMRGPGTPGKHGRGGHGGRHGRHGPPPADAPTPPSGQ